METEFPKKEVEAFRETERERIQVDVDPEGPDKENTFERGLYLELFDIFSKAFDPVHNFQVDATTKDLFTNKPRLLPYVSDPVPFEGHINSQLSRPNIFSKFQYNADVYTFDKTIQFISVKPAQKEIVTPLLKLVLDCTSDYGNGTGGVIAKLLQMYAVCDKYKLNFKLYAAFVCHPIVKAFVLDAVHALTKTPIQDDPKYEEYIYVSPQIYVWVVTTPRYAVVFKVESDFNATLTIRDGDSFMDPNVFL